MDEDRQPRYRRDPRTGRYLPANQAAQDEVDRWNAWAAAINARTRRLLEEKGRIWTWN